MARALTKDENEMKMFMLGPVHCGGKGTDGRREFKVFIHHLGTLLLWLDLIPQSLDVVPNLRRWIDISLKKAQKEKNTT